jgi:hypothetical protein
MDGQLMDEKQDISTWDNYKITFDSYQAYLQQKVKLSRSKYELDFVDLLYASNYKGGSGSIQEDLFRPASIANLALYSDLLKVVYETFGKYELKDLTYGDL